MKIGMIGLGKMGLNLVQNLIHHQHQVVAYDLNTELVAQAAECGAEAAASTELLVAKLEKPRIVWMMVPAGKIVDSVIESLTPLLESGDILIDGGNSHYKDSIARAARLAEQGIHYFDAGTSGGMEGAHNGGCFMIGGNRDVFSGIEPLFKDMAVENGYLYAGESGSGHFL